MLEYEFYPTQPKTIRHMRSKLTVPLSKRKRFFDPSAGDGRILDYFRDNCRYELSGASFFACEIQPDLVALLQGKGYAVLEHDFLLFIDPIQFDVILANPPFSKGVRHAIKMWEVLEPDGETVCLLNWQNIKFIREPDPDQTINQYQQFLAELVKQYGYVEYLGKEFKDAERRTDVEVGLVYLRKPKRSSGIGFDGVNVTSDYAESDRTFTANFLAQGDMIKSLVAQYNQARELLIQRNEIQAQLNFYLKGVCRAHYGSVSAEEQASLGQAISLNQQIKALKAQFWSFIFVKTNVGQKATSDFVQKFTDFAAANTSMAFTEQNIREVLGVFMSNIAPYMQEAVVRVFDKATAYHENNRVHHEGWRTNKGWKVNYRIIIPGGVSYDPRWSNFKADYSNRGFLDDLDRVLCWISGSDVSDPGFIGAYSALDNHCDNRGGAHYSDKFYSSFFAMRMFKKGTLHIDFQDLDLLDEFNRIAAEGKNWIGGQGF